MNPLRLAATATLVAAALAPPPPASAASAYTIVVNGNMTTTGTWEIVTLDCGSSPCPATNSWLMAGVGVGSHGTAAGTLALDGHGRFVGWCGTSTGSGTIVVTGSVNGTAEFGWTSNGGTTVGSGTMVIGGRPHAFTLLLEIRPTSPGGDCVTRPAMTFAVSGVAAGA